MNAEPIVKPLQPDPIYDPEPIVKLLQPDPIYAWLLLKAAKTKASGS